MKKQFNRAISWILAALMMLSMLPVSGTVNAVEGEKAEMTVSAQNAKIYDAVGIEIPTGTYEGIAGDVLVIRPVPDTGYALASVTVDGSVLAGDAEGIYRITVADGSAISVIASDATDPRISTVERKPAGWAQEAVYSFTVTDAESGVSTVTVKVGEEPAITLTANESGIYSFTVDQNTSFEITATDVAGNTDTATGSETMIDNALPEITDIVRDGNGWTKNAVYSVGVAAAHGVASVTLQTDGGEPAALTANESGGYTFTATKNGVYTITVTDSRGVFVSRNVTENQIDNAPPVISDIQRDSDTWAQKTTYTFQVTDAQSGVQKVAYKVNGEETVLTAQEGIYSFTVDGNGVCTIIAVDNLDNSASMEVSEQRIDTSAPEIVDLARTETGWQKKATYSFGVMEEQSGIATVTVKIGEDEPISVAADEDGVYRFAVVRNATITVAVTDQAGNADSKTITENGIDTDAPVITDISRSTSGWESCARYTFKVTDSTSGVTTVTVQFADNEPTSLVPNAAGYCTLEVRANGTYTITAKDAAGNDKTEFITESKVDTTAPSGITVAYATEAESGYNRIVDGVYIYNDTMGFAAKGTDDSSGIVKYEYRIVTGDNQTEWVSVTGDGSGFREVVADLADGLYYVYVRAYDAAGNCSEEATVTENGKPVPFVLENTPATDAERGSAPEVNMTTPKGSYAGAWTAETVTVTVSGGAAISGAEHYEYRIDYADPALTDLDWGRVPVAEDTASITVANDTNATYYFRAVSYAGNYSQITSRVVKVQKTLPNAATITQDAATGTNGWYTKYPNYTVSLSSQGEYSAPVHYVISYTHNDGVSSTSGKIDYDGTNAPKIANDGYWTICIEAHDEAGNVATRSESTAQFAVDTDAPTGVDVLLDGESILSANAQVTDAWDSVNIRDEAIFTDFSIFRNQSVSISAVADGGVSGMAAIYYMVVTDNGDYAPTGNWKLLDGWETTLAPDSKCHVFFKAVDKAGNTTYFSGTSFILDAAAPTGNGTDAMTLTPLGTNRSIHGVYSGDVTVSVQVNDPMIGEDLVFAGLQSVTYNVYRDGAISQSGQLYPGTGTTTEQDGRIQAWSGSFVINAESNNSNHIVVEVTARDMAGNTKTSRIGDGQILIDITSPTMESSYDRNDVTTVFAGDTIFTGSRTLTVTVTERNFIPEESLVTVKDTDTGSVVSYHWESSGYSHTVKIPVTEDGHYEVSASITDAAGNNTTAMGFVLGTTGARSFVIDNTNPVVTVSYDNNTANQEHYFNSARIATIQVEERNFNPDNIEVKFLLTGENGGRRYAPVSGWTVVDNTHTAYVICDEEGIYDVSVSGTDAAGNSAEGIQYYGSATKYFVVDTHIDAPVISDVTDGSAYAGTITPKATVLDTNLYSVSATLLRTRRNEIGMDVTEEMISGKVIWKTVSGGKDAVFDVFQKIQEMDGVYTLIVSCEDKAGNRNESTVTFSVNRFGSVYVYDSALIDTMDAYLHSLENDLIITEYNPSGLVAGSARVSITLDGVPIAEPVYTVSPAIDGKEQPGESGWFEYRYVIAAENFAEDGVYEVVISTQDNAGNVPENTADEMLIRFAIDTKAPELTSIVGLEQDICKADSINVVLSALDNVALDSIVVYLDGEILAQWEDIAAYEQDAAFTVPSGYRHHVRIVVTDKAGNVLDTDSEDFAPGYAYNDYVTVSTNPFLRFYANKPLFYGVIAFVGLTGGIIVFLLSRKRRAGSAKAAKGK